MTKRNLGGAQMDKDGYVVPASWEGGYLFFRPPGSLAPNSSITTLKKGSEF
jgi:hypothetical protein